MSKRTTALAALAALAFGAGSIPVNALAQESVGGWYVEGHVGQADYREADDDHASWGISGGYRFNPFVAAEIGYLDFGRLSESVPGVGTARLNGSAFEVAGVGSYPVAGRFSVYGKLGVHRGQVRARLNLVDLEEFRGRERNTDLTYGIGVQFDPRRNIGIIGGWQRYVDVGDATDVDTLSVGLQFRF